MRFQGKRYQKVLLGAWLLTSGLWPGGLLQASSTQRVDLNTASLSALVDLQGIGVKKARAIILYRQRSPFRRPSELLLVKGIGKRLYRKVRPYVCVAPACVSPQ